VKEDPMPVRIYCVNCHLRDGVIEAFGIRMGKNYGDNHIEVPLIK
jgi:hypothetical protein